MGLPEQSRVRPLARHGSTLVYVGQLPRSKREVVLKICFTPFMTPLQQQQAYLHLRQEVSRLQALKNPHVLAPLTVRKTWQGLVFVSAYAPAGSLQQLLPGPLPQDRALTIIRQIGEALRAAHQQGIVHGNLMPNNVLFMQRAPEKTVDDALRDQDQPSELEKKDYVALSDFYLPSLASVQIVSSGNEQPQLRHYMAPEQFLGQRSALADQYALAAIAYELFTGKTPFAGSARTTLQHKHTYVTPPAPDTLNPDLPVVIARAISKGLSKDPAARFASVQDFLNALEAIEPPVMDAVATLPIEAKTIGSPAPVERADVAQSLNVTRRSRTRIRTRWLLMSVALLFLLLATGAFFATGAPFFNRSSTVKVVPTPLATAKSTITQQARIETTAVATPSATPKPTSLPTVGVTSTPTATLAPLPTATPTTPVMQVSPTPVPTSNPAGSPVAPGTVKPILECVHLQGASGYVAKFGYLNTSSDNVTIPVGDNNMIVPSQYSGSLPTNFVPGRQYAVVQINASSGDVLVWALNGATATASALSTRC
ncbi:serine/threonine protein kinase [Dictyobacter aurantiacus]|nr:serine/threonine-protein kinase [Dictyobacter aurantiacus]